MAAIASPFFIDLDGLRLIASDPIIKRGLAYFEENRVIEVEASEDRLWAQVVGSDPGAPYCVEIDHADGELWIDCECPFEWEPVCKHAVAALLAWGGRRHPADVGSAADEAVSERIKRGRREVEVVQLGTDVFGTWSARSVASARPTAQMWFVELRSLDEKINFCDCPDFATNMLGTCKHVEAVRHKARKLNGGDVAGPQHSHVFEAWDGPGAGRVRLWAPDGARDPELDPFFDADGYLREPVVETFHRLRRFSRQRPALVVGEDAVRHVDRLAEDARCRERAAEIHADIDRASGRVAGVRAQLYPYQVDGVAFLAAAGRAVLADDMGLGKTLQAIAAASLLTRRSDVRRTLVVCPASLKHQWAREIRKFTDFDVEVVQGSASGRRAQYQRHAAFTIVNYELVIRDWEVINTDLAADLIVLDEAQRIKNWRTKTADAVKALQSRYAFVLTGTPLENRLEDLYSVMQVVDPRVLGPLWRYMAEFHITDDRGKVVGYRNLTELRRRLASVMLRRDRREVRSQLPARIDARLDVEMTPRQRALHDAAVDNAGSIARIMKKRPLTPAEEKQLMASLQSARMAADGANLVDEAETGVPPKIAELRRLLEDLAVESGRKVVVFSEWRRMTQQAVDVATELGLEPVYLHGGVPTSKRGDLLLRFEEDPAARVFVSTDAGGVGLNLQSASVLINLDIPWNPAVLEQRIGRVHRLGQTESVQIVKLVSAGSYEERVLEVVASKQLLFENVISPDAEEDVVGVSKRTLEMLAEALDASDPIRGAVGDRAEPEPVESADPPMPAAREETHQVELDRRIDETLSELERALPGRIQRVLATAAGLVLVVDHVDDIVEDLVAEASKITPFIALDMRSARQLARLGPSSPLAMATVVSSRNVVEDDWVMRRLDAAETLMNSGMHRDAVRLAAEAIQSELCVCADVPLRGIAPSESVVWLHTDVAPRLAAHAEIATATQLFALSGANAEVPASLASSLLASARQLQSVLREQFRARTDV